MGPNTANDTGTQSLKLLDTSLNLNQSILLWNKTGPEGLNDLQTGWSYRIATLNSLGMQGRGGGGFSHLMLTGLFRHDTSNITNSFIMSSAKFLPVFAYLQFWLILELNENV